MGDRRLFGRVRTKRCRVVLLDAVAITWESFMAWQIPAFMNPLLLVAGRTSRYDFPGSAGMRRFPTGGGIWAVSK